MSEIRKIIKFSSYVYESIVSNIDNTTTSNRHLSPLGNILVHEHEYIETQIKPLNRDLEPIIVIYCQSCGIYYCKYCGRKYGNKDSAIHQKCYSLRLK
jgi:hypothetical protein